jgi:HK97 family phage portal protein
MAKTTKSTAVVPAPEARSVLENPAYSLNDPRTWELVFDGPTSEAGVRVTVNKFLSLAAILQCVSLISQDVAKLPFDLFAKSDAGRTKVTEHPVHNLIHWEPNEEQIAFDFWQLMIVHKLIWGNAYAWIERDRAGRPMSLMPLMPTMTSPIRRQGRLFYAVKTRTKTDYLEAGDVIHLKGVSLNGLEGLALLDLARDAVARAIAAGNFTSKFFKNGLKASGFMMFPNGMDKTARDRAEGDFKKRIENSENAFRVHYLPDGIKFVSNSVSPSDGQMIESREHEVREVARYFNLPPSRLGLSDSVSYNSKSEDNQNYLDSALSPHLIQIAQECRRKLLTPQEKNDDHYFEHNTKSLLMMSALQRFQIYALGIRVGVLNPNECRAAENMNAREGGDIFLAQTNLAGYGQTGSADNQGLGISDNPANQTHDPVNSLDPGTGTRSVSIPAMRLMYGLARLARHKAEKPHAFRQWTETRWSQFEREAQAAEMPSDFVEQLRTKAIALCKSTPPDQLPQAVDQLASQWESSVCQTDLD